MPEQETRVCEHRAHVSDDAVLRKLGVDSGGGLVKLCKTIQFPEDIEGLTHFLCCFCLWLALNEVWAHFLSFFLLLFLSLDEPTRRRRVSYSSGLKKMRQFSNGGEKKLQMLADVHAGDEKYDELVELVASMNITETDFDFVSLDLKAMNAMLGLMTHSATHPCPYCHWILRSRNNDAEMRTFEGIRSFYDAWKADGGRKEKRADFFLLSQCSCGSVPENRNCAVRRAPELH